uniref:RNase H type-1 domain-containing protein n=1 Tax=Cannabis sativa TaxID=3483 RepID=A0A803PCT3_CANSA
MNQWDAKLFSIGGREVLLKAVVHSIPTYAMSCFSLPKKFCNQLESMMANFWWGFNTNNSKIYWKKWKFMCSSKADCGMGFRSFIHSNQALLEKQAWRIMDIPDSLLARVLKARYFKNGDFLSAQFGILPSLTWQSICDGKEVLLKGLTCKIGTGQNVRCASDPWLPGNTNFTPYSYGGDPLFTVKHYISTNRQWYTQILEHHFGAIDIECILSIPLSHFPKEDKLIWHHSDTGFYTVKTGYHLAVSLDSMDEHSSSSSHRHWWNRLWSLRLPKKVKIFAWRLVNDALPTSVNLAHRKITPFTACTLYKCGWESAGHAIFCCDRAKAVWKKFRYNVYIPNIELITCLMWSIWFERNKEIHGTKPKPADLICTFVVSHLAQYQKATTPAQNQAAIPATKSENRIGQAQHQRLPVRSPPVWKPLTVGCYKLNLDAACENGAILGFGALIQDHTGAVIVGFLKPYRRCFLPKEMEAAVMFHSVQWAIEYQIPIHFIETDSLLVDNTVNNMSSTRFVTPFHDLVDDICYLLSSFPRAKVPYVKRDANKAAHALAKFALRFDEDIFWLGEIPSPIYFVVINDSHF